MAALGNKPPGAGRQQPQLQRAACLPAAMHGSAKPPALAAKPGPSALTGSEGLMAKKNTTPMASTKARCGRRAGNRLWRVPAQPSGHCPAEAANHPCCSREWSASVAVVLGGDASTTTSPVWICLVYLHKHTGFSILPFIRGPLCLARPPCCWLPPAALPPAVSRAVSSFLSSCALPLPGLIFCPDKASPSASMINHHHPCR